MRPCKLYRNFNHIRVRSFILSGAPFALFHARFRFFAIAFTGRAVRMWHKTLSCTANQIKSQSAKSLAGRRRTEVSLTDRSSTHEQILRAALDLLRSNFTYALAGGCRNEETKSVRRIATRILRNKSPKRAISTPAERIGIKAAAEYFVSNR
jgi:hypothetical protein